MRRAWGTGSIYQRASDRRWIGSASDGRGGRRYVTGKDEATVRRRLRELVRSATSRRASDEPTADYLARWLRDARTRVRPRTHERYSNLMSTHILPAVGHIPLGRLTPDDVQAMVTGILERRSPQTARHAHNVLRAALGQAERWELVPRNVARLVKAPRVALAQVPTIEPTDVRRFLDSLPRGTYGALFMIRKADGR